jgi:hypothetical protein
MHAINLPRKFLAIVSSIPPNPDIELSAPPFLSAFTLSSSALLLSRGLVLPLDRLKVLLQTDPVSAPSARDVITRGYRGLSARLAGSVVYSGFHIAGLSIAETVVRSDTSTGLFVAHNFAKLGATTVAYPFDVRYTHRACGAKVSRGLRSSFAGITLGIVGVPISVLGSISTLSFLSLIFPLEEVNMNHDFARGVAVGAAGAIGGSVLSYPIDTVRRRVITGKFRLKEAIKAGRFFRGIGVLLIKAIPESALLTYSYMCNLRYFSFVASS